MKKAFVFLFAVLMVCKGWCDVEITIQRADSRINAGFRERIFVDGRERLALANGTTGKFTVPDGDHTIHAELYTLKTDRMSFNAQGGPITFVVTPYSTSNFVIERSGASPPAPAPSAPTPSAPAPSRPAASQPNSGGVEGSLELAAEKIMEKIPDRARVAIVYVTSNDPEITEFIANELEFIMVGRGLRMIDRSQLDAIRREQNLQMSGEIDDRQAVSIGKISGASVIITGAVTGSGSLRRLRLRALDTQTAEVLSAASERY